MAMNNETAANKKDFILAILVLGSICGFVEVVVGGVLHRFGFHLSGFLIGLDCILIGGALAIYRNPLMIIGMVFVSCIYKQLAVPLRGTSFMCEANSCLAVLLEYGSLAAISAFTLKGMGKNMISRIVTGSAGVFVGSIIYYFAGMRVNPCPYMLTFNAPGGFMAFLAKEGLIWAVFAGVLLPLGWSLGEKFNHRTFVSAEENILFYYLKSALTVIICLAASGIFISVQG
jgi:hypothetical protein